MEFNLRKLNTGDIFKIIRIIRKFGIDEIRKCLNAVIYATEAKRTNKNDKNVFVAVIMEFIATAAEHLPDCEKEIYIFLGDLCNVNPEEIESLPPAETMKVIKKVVNMPEFSDFFTEVSNLFTTETKTEN